MLRREVMTTSGSDYGIGIWRVVRCANAAVIRQTKCITGMICDWEVRGWTLRTLRHCASHAIAAKHRGEYGWRAGDAMDRMDGKQCDDSYIEYLGGPADGMIVDDDDADCEFIDVVTKRSVYRYERIDTGDFKWLGTVRRKATRGEGGQTFAT